MQSTAFYACSDIKGYSEGGIIKDKTKERQGITAQKHHIMLHLTDTKYEIVSESAKITHLPLAEYIRK